MLSTTASATAAAATTASPAAAAATAVFLEQTPERQCTVDNDATATTGDNERERDDRRRAGSDRERRGLSEYSPEYVPELRARHATESVHAASDDATADRAAGNLLVGTPG